MGFNIWIDFMTSCIMFFRKLLIISSCINPPIPSTVVFCQPTALPCSMKMVLKLLVSGHSTLLLALIATYCTVMVLKLPVTSHATLFMLGVGTQRTPAYCTVPRTTTACSTPPPPTTSGGPGRNRTSTGTQSRAATGWNERSYDAENRRTTAA